MDSSTLLGSVAVEVKADLSKLVAGFAQAKGQSQALAGDLGKVTAASKLSAAEQLQLANAYNQLSQTYSPLKDKMERYKADLAQIAQINASKGMFSQAEIDRLNAGVAAFARSHREFAALTTGVAGSSEEAATATGHLEKQYAAVVQQVDPLNAAQMKYGQQLATIAAAEKAGVATTAEANAMRANAATALASVTAQLEKGEGAHVHYLRRVEQNIRAVRLLGVVFGVDMVGRLAGFVTKSLEATAALGDEARALGLTTTQLQEYRGMAAQVGMSSADMDIAFKTLGKNIDDLALGRVGPFSKLLKKFNIDLKDSGGQAKSTSKLFDELVQKFGQVRDKAQQSGGAMIAFGEAGSKMGLLFQMGTEGMHKLMQAVMDTGGVISPELIANADQAAKKLEEVKTVLEANIASTVAANSAAIVDLAGALASLTGSILGFMNSHPEVALGIIGALGGAMVGGTAGAAVGAAAGVVTGVKMAQLQADSNTNIGFRRQALQDSLGEFRARRDSSQDSGGIISIRHSRGATSGGTVESARQEVLRQMDLLSNAVATERQRIAPTKPKGPNIDLSGILAPKGPKGKKGAQPKFDRFESDLAQEEQRQLQLDHDATTDIVEQNRIEKEIIEKKQIERDRQVDRQIKSKELTASEGEELKHQIQITTDKEMEEADHKLRLAQIEHANQFADELARLDVDGLNTARQLARTDAQRKTIDLAILDSKQQQAKSELQKEIDLAIESKDEQRVRELTEEMAKLRANQLADIKEFNVEHLNAMQQFQRNLPETAEQFNDQVKSMAFAQFNEKLQQAGQFASDLGDDFGKAAADLAQFKPRQALQDLINGLAQTFTKNFIEKPVSDFVKDHLGVPLAKQAFGGQLDKLAKEAGGTALTTNQMNTALATATQSLYALTHAAEAASSAVGAKGVAGGAGAAMDFSSVLAGSTGTFSASDLNGLNSGTLGRVPLKIPDFGFAAPTSAKDHPAAHDGELQFDRSLKALARSSDETASSTDKTTTALNSATPSVDRLAGAADRAAEALSRVSASGGGGGGGAGGFSGSSIAGLFGGGGSASLGSLFSAAGGFGDAFSSIGAFSAGDLGSLAGSLGDFPLAFGFAGGGYTGSGSDSDPAGIVHANEFVVHADAVRKIGLPFLHSLNGGVGSQAKKPDDGRLPGYAVGGFVGTEPLLPSAIFRSGGDPVATAPTPAPATGHVTVTGPGQATGPASLNDAAAMLMQAAQMLMQVAQAQGGGGKGGGLGGLLSMGIGLLAGGVFGGGGKNAGGLLGALLGGGGKSGLTGGLNPLSLGGMLVGGGPFSGATLGGLGGTLGGVPLSIPGFDGGGFTGSGPRNQIKGFAHAGEYIWDADTTRQWLPALQMISARRIPGFTGPGPGSPFGGGRAGDTNHFNLGGVHIQGANDERSARRSGRQALGEIQRGIASAARKGMIHRSNP